MLALFGASVAASRFPSAAANGPTPVSTNAERGPERCDDAKATTPQWKLVSELAVGGAEDTTLIWANGVSVDRRLRMFVPHGYSIRVLDSSGKVSAVWGQKGQGPGDIAWLQGAGLVGDTLWVADYTNEKVISFFPDGRFRARSVANVIESLHGLYYRSRPFVVGALHDGSIILDVTTVNDRSEYRQPLQPDPTIRYLLVDSKDRVVDTILERSRWGTEFEHTIEPVRKGGLQSAITPQPLGDEPLFGNDPAGRGWVVVDRRVPLKDTASMFRVTVSMWKRPGGFTRSYRYRPCPVPRRVRDSLSVIYANRAAPEEIMRELRPVKLQPFYPAVTSVVMTETGGVWLRREGLEFEEARWERLDAQGNLEGFVITPPRTKLFAAKGNRLWGLRWDDDSVATVHRWRLERTK